MYQRYRWQAERKPLHGMGRLVTCSRFIFLWPLIIISGLTSCTAHYSVNDAIESTESVQRYSLLKETKSNRSDELVVYLAFSGGGTRAAAFSYGVLKKLAETEIIADGHPRRFIDEVDVISSVSGGSFTAAYYGLFGDKIFEDFEQKYRYISACLIIWEFDNVLDYLFYKFHFHQTFQDMFF